MNLPETPDELQALSLELDDFRRTELGEILQQRLDALRDSALSDMEIADTVEGCFRAQGRYAAFKRAAGLLNEIRSDVKRKSTDT